MIVSNIEVVARTTERFAKEVMEQVNTPQPEIANISELQSEEIQQTVALTGQKRNRKVNTYRSKQEYTRFCGI